jgi:hypothetical protein
MEQENQIEKEVNDSVDPIIRAYHKQMNRSIGLASIIGSSIGHLRNVQNMTEDTIVKKYIDGCIADIQEKFKTLQDEE